MKFNIITKNVDGSVEGNFTLSQIEATFVLNIGLNYLAAKGAMPTFTGTDEDGQIIAAPTGTIQ